MFPTTGWGESPEDTFFFVHKKTGDLVAYKRPKENPEDYNMFNRVMVAGEAHWTINKMHIEPEYLPGCIKLFLELEKP